MDSSAGSQVIEEFWGVELTSSNKEVKWLDLDEEPDSLYADRTLELRQACLGASAKDGERNVVELTTDDDAGETVSHTILSMRVGAAEQSTLFLTLRSPVTLKLVKGNGPVHIIGQTNETLDVTSMMSSDDESLGEESDTEISEKIASLTSKKRLATSIASNPAKMVKLSANRKKNGLENGSDGSEEDDDDSEEMEEEESEEEEESAPPPAKNKKQMKNGNSAKKQKSVVFKTPQPPKPNGTPQKGTASAPTTPKSGKKSGGKETPNVNEIKERLTKMSVPKKLEKFNNFISNSFKIKDDSVKKQLWEFVQKKRPVE